VTPPASRRAVDALIQTHECDADSLQFLQQRSEVLQVASEAIQPPDVLAYFRQQGAKGGRIGGCRALETMTPAQRVARAKKSSAAAAAAARKRSAKKTN
jgi:hypothetical protein